MTKGAGEGLGHLPVSGSGIDENVSLRQAIDEFLEETFGVPLLIGVVEKDLERPLICFALRVEDLYRFCLRHAFFLWNSYTNLSFCETAIFNFSAWHGAAEIGGVLVILGSEVQGSIDPPSAIIDLDGRERC
jgi:hypothetical protein